MSYFGNIKAQLFPYGEGFHMLLQQPHDAAWLDFNQIRKALKNHPHSAQYTENQGDIRLHVVEGVIHGSAEVAWR